MNSSVLITMCVTLLLPVAGGPLGAAGENIALGRPYEWSTPPRYHQCADGGDATQLTDGISEGANWSLPSTVGWVHQGRVEVTIDLGSPQPIERVAFVAAGGGFADVFFPAVTAILTSDDGEAWHLAAAVGSGALVQDRTQSYAHTFETAELATRGRYVRLVFQAEERYLFLDEIEVHSADTAAAPEGEPITAEELDAVLERGLTARWVAGEWPGFRRQIEALAAPAGTQVPAGIAPQLEEIDARVARMDVSDAGEVEALRRAYTGLRAEVARAAYGARVHVQRVYPWGDYRGDTLPPSNEGLPTALDLALWQDEYETAAWAVTNLTDRPVRVRPSVSALSDADGRALSWEDRLWLRYGMPIPARVGYRVMDALPLLSAGDGEAAELGVEAGEYRLVWLTVQARDLPPGDYRAQLRVHEAESGDVLADSPLALTVAPLRMPPTDERALSVQVWEYLTGWDQPPEAAEDLRAHGVNTWSLHPVALPVPTFDRDQGRLEAVDFAAFDAALARCGDHPRMHSVFWGGNPTLWGLDLESPEGAEMFRQFIRAWGAHLEAAGIAPDEFFFYPLDEETSERLVRIATQIQEADPRFRVFWNHVNNASDDPDLIREVTPVVDIACLNILTQDPRTDLSAQEAAFAEARREHPLEVWTYACKGPGRLMPPDRYYRNLSWETFRRGGTGTGFWCYADGSGWDAYEGGIPYGVVYFADDAPPGVTRVEPIIPSRRWEAFREGAEDFEYLARLQHLIALAGETPARARAADVLSEAVDAVLTAPDDPDRYDRAREALTEAILELQ